MWQTIFCGGECICEYICTSLELYNIKCVLKTKTETKPWESLKGEKRTWELNDSVLLGGSTSHKDWLIFRNIVSGDSSDADGWLNWSGPARAGDGGSTVRGGEIAWGGEMACSISVLFQLFVSLLSKNWNVKTKFNHFILCTEMQERLKKDLKFRFWI